MKIFLIRHGYSVANSKGLVTGDKNDVLESSQIDRVNDLADWLSKNLNIRIDKYYVSDWKRAQQTANIVNPNAEWIIDDRIGETDAGSVKNLTLNEFLKIAPYFYKDHSNRYPDGESHLELNERVLKWLKELIAKTEVENVIVVTHSGPITCLLQHVCGVDMANFPMFLPDNSSISCIEFTKKEHGQFESKLKLFSAGPCLMLNNLPK